MDAQQFFLLQQATTTTVVDQLVIAGLTDDQLRLRPGDGHNSLAWLLWHSARWEDVIINTWIGDRPQVFDTNPRTQDLGVATRHVGTAMTADDVTALSDRIDLAALHAYRAATTAATAGLVGALTATDLDTEITVERLAAAAPDGAYHNPQAAWMDEFWTGHPIAWFLAFLNLHTAEHLLGEALAVRSQLGIPLGL
jgi:hypothetical protein